MKSNNNITGADFIDTLLLRHHITLKMVYDCAAARHDELETMEQILDLQKDEDVRCFLAAARIIDPDGADDIIARFREKAQEHESTNWIAGIEEPSPKDYALLIISAFIYNTPFLAMTWKRCDMLKEEISHAGQREPKRGNDDGVRKAFVSKPRKRECFHRFEYRAAAPAVPAFRNIGMPFEFEEGTLDARCAQFEDYYFQLCFTPKQPVTSSYILEVRFTTLGDQGEHTLRLCGSPDTPEADSNPDDGKGIDYTGGIEITSTNLEFIGEE